MPPDALFVDTLATGDIDRLVVFDGRRLFRLGAHQWQPKPLAIEALPTITAANKRRGERWMWRGM